MLTGNTTVSSKHALCLAIKAINDEAGPNEMVTTLLVFGFMPRLPIKSHNLFYRIARLKAMKYGHEEATRIVAQSRLATAIASSVPSAADSDIIIGDEALLFGEKSMRKWTGAFVVTNVDKTVLNLDSGICNRLESIVKVKVYRHSSLDFEYYPSKTVARAGEHDDHRN